MATTKSWIKAARLRTLPLALSGILAGSGLAWFYGAFDLLVCALAIITATLLQIFSNFANDYGDYQKGTDNHQRLGPTRTMQGGEITVREMKTGLWSIGGLSFLTGLWLVYAGTWHYSKAAFAGFIGFGVLSLIAAYFYTAGKKSYGYVGLGDLSVFLFFGLMPVLGVFYLNAHTIGPNVIHLALTLGFFSAGVLNLNNLRDIENDRQSGKITIAVRMGPRNSRIYHTALILTGWWAAVIFTVHQQRSGWQWIFLLTAPLFLLDLVKIWQTRDARQLDPFLKRLALATLAFTLLFCLGLILATR
jgi:1,4-dihydroxy-2-naphthoate octaprenyltransferase